jgi:hypothetical protein
VNDLIDEARRMPDASVRFAREVYEVQTPKHLIPLRKHVRSHFSGALQQIETAIDKRFGTTGASTDYINVFYAAGEMALMEQVSRKSLSSTHRQTLRSLWENLLAAR